jgi:XRE family transcriptional regulator, regulator of sulfur utilization
MNNVAGLAEKIRLYRLQKGLSQENMADMLGLSTTAYGDIERGRTELSVSRLESIAQLLEVSIADLMGIEPVGLSETEWLRQENARLIAVNLKLQRELEQLKITRWFGEGILADGSGQRERIGFK